jgi:hypothetical protein
MIAKQGYIMGLISKEGAENLLCKEEPGTFLVRFSMQSAGAFAIAYTLPGKLCFVTRN